MAQSEYFEFKGEDAGSQTILDSWDASQIVGVNKTQVPAGLNETIADPCVSLKEKFLMPKPAFPGKTSFHARHCIPIYNTRCIVKAKNKQ